MPRRGREHDSEARGISKDLKEVLYGLSSQKEGVSGSCRPLSSVKKRFDFCLGQWGAIARFQRGN